MARLLVYDAYENKVYTYSNLRENDPMPYSTGRTLTVREFRGKSNSPVLWTTIAAMEAWNLTRRKYGRGIPVGYAFRRIWEGGHGTRSQHYAGVAFDVGQSLSQTQRTAIYNAARSTGAWGYVEPLSQTPTWVHFDRRYGTPACRGTTAGYPTLRRGSRGCYVMILQDALSTLGYQTGNRIDGIFGSNLTYLNPELKNRPWFHEVDVSKYIAYFISALNHDASISSLLDPHAKIDALLQKRALEKAKIIDEQL